jgi:RND family efflux transporter MFP subunit
MQKSAQSVVVGALSRDRDATHPKTSDIPAPTFRWTSRVLIPGGILIGIALLFLGATWRALIPAMNVSAVSVVERPTEASPVGTVVVQAAGWIEADPHLVYASALTGGVIDSIDVLEGDRVSESQVIARLVSDEAQLALSRAEAEVAHQEALVAEAQARLRAMQTNWDNPVDRIRAADVAESELAESRSLLHELEAQIVGAVADAARLEREHERFAELRDSRTVSDSEYLTARTAWESQEATLEALRRRQSVVRAQIERQEAELRAALDNQRLRIQERQDLETAQAALNRAEAALESAEVRREEATLRVERMEVRAPIDGVVVERFCEPGVLVMVNAEDRLMAAVVSLYDPDHLQVRVDIPLADAAAVAEGQRAEISIDALPNTIFNGVVTRVLHQADIQKNTIEVKVAVLDPSPLLRPEMLARVRILGGQTESEESGQTLSLFAPEGSLVEGGVWRVEAYDGSHGVARSQAVSVRSPAHEGWVEVTDGLNPGDLVIAPVPADLQDGRRIAVTLNSN